MISQNEHTAAQTISTSCCTTCIVCSRLAKHAGKWSQSENTNENTRANILPGSQTPRKQTRQSETFPNPYITPPREFISAILQLKGTSDHRKEDHTDFRCDRQEDVDRDLIVAANEITSESGAVRELNADPGVESDDEDDCEVVTDLSKSQLMTQPCHLVSTVQLPLSEPKYNVGDALFITPSNNGIVATQNKYGPLTVTKRIHSSALEAASLGASIESVNCWYYHLAWDVMEGINWCPDEYFWHEDRLLR